MHRPRSGLSFGPVRNRQADPRIGRGKMLGQMFPDHSGRRSDSLNSNGSGSQSLTSRSVTDSPLSGKGKSHGAGMLSSSHGGSGRSSVVLLAVDSASSLTRTGP